MSKIKNLPSTSTLADADVMYAVDDSVGVNGGRKITKADLKNDLALTEAEVKTRYENNADTNPFTDSEKASLAGIIPLSNVVVVQKTPGSGEFDDIQLAIDSVTTESISNPFLIDISAGEFLPSNTITLKPHVFLTGKGPATVIKITDPTKTLFIGAADTCLKDMHIFGSGMDGSLTPLITYAGSSTGTINEDFLFHNVSFGATYKCIEVDTPLGNLSKVILRNCEFRCQYLKNGFSVTGAGISFFYLDSFVLRSPFIGVSIDKFFEFSSPTCTAILNDIIIEIEDLATFSTFLEVSNGAITKGQGIYVNNVDDGIKVLNIGTAPDINISTFSLFNVANKTIDILHPATTGSLSGTFSHMINIAEPSTFTTSHTIPSGGISLTGDLRQGAKASEVTNLSRFIREGGVTGLIEGGALSKPGGLTVSITEGCGYLKGPTGGFIDEVPFAAQSITATDGINNFISVNENGILQLTTSPPPFEQVIFLGRAVTRGNEVLYIENSQISMVQYSVELEKFLRLTLGTLYRSGSLVTENGTRKLDITAGVYSFGVKPYEPVGGTAVTWDTFYRDGSGGDLQILNEDTISNTLYDDDSGTLATIPAGKFVKHSIFTVGDGANEHYLCQVGQELFDLEVDAEGGEIPITGTAFVGSVVLLATLIVSPDTVNILQIKDERPRLRFTASGTSADSSHGNLLNLNVDSHHPGYLTLDGTRSMASSLNLGGNAITNVGVVDNVTVSNHSDRHLPNGSDPINTSAPSTALDGNSTNEEGIDNNLSRSDHTHEIKEATTLVGGLLSSTDKNTLDANSVHRLTILGNPHAITPTDIGLSNVTNDAQIPLSQKGAANGVASLDASSRIPASQLPTSAMEYKGAWNVSTNTPTLIDGSGTNGDTYRVSVSGSIDLGSGNETYDVGDALLYNGTIWEKIPADDLVSSVNGSIGIVVLDTDNISEGAINNYSNTSGGQSDISGNSDVSDNSTHRGSDGSDHSLVTSHASRHQTGGADAIPVATPSVDGLLDSSDKTKLDKLDIGYMQYTNSSLVTSSGTTRVDSALNTDRESFTNSNFTKFSTTEFQTDFAGRIEISYSADGRCTSANDRAWEVGIAKNGTDQEWTFISSISKNNAIRTSNASRTIVISCSVGDKFKLRFGGKEGGNNYELIVDGAFMSTKVYNK